MFNQSPANKDWESLEDLKFSKSLAFSNDIDSVAIEGNKLSKS